MMESITGTTYSSIRLSATVKSAIARPMKMTFFSLTDQASRIIYAEFCHILYLGLGGLSFLVFTFSKVRSP